MLDSPRAERGTYRDVTCAADDCDKPARCKGLCDSHYSKARWAAGYRPPSVNARSRRNAHLKHRYGITLVEYEALLEEQGDRCAVCRTPSVEAALVPHWNGSWAVDHCHETGKVRGLLCNDCNLILKRHFTADRLRAAADYLDRHS